MKIKIIFVLFVFIASGVITANSAEQSPPAGQQPAPAVQSAPADKPAQAGKASEGAVQAAQARIEQAKTALTEIKEILKEEEKTLAERQKLDKQAKEPEAEKTQSAKAAENTRKEIQKLRDQIKDIEKELTEQTKTNARLQSEAARIQKDRIEAESKTQQAEAKLGGLQKELADLKDRLAEATKKSEDAKKASRDLGNATATLQAEKEKRAESLARAEQIVARAEQAEKERLLLSSRIADIEQNIPRQPQGSQDVAKVESEIVAEKKLIAETGEQIKKEEKACEENEKAVIELQKQLSAKQKLARAGGPKEADPAELQKQLVKLRRQRAGAEERLKKSEAEQQDGAKKVAALTIQVAAAQPEKAVGERGDPSRQSEMESALESERKALAEAESKIKDSAKAQAESEKLIANLKNQLKEHEKTAGASGQKEDKSARLQSQLADLQKQRAEAEGRLKKAEGRLQESAKALAALSGTIYAADEDADKNKEAIAAEQARIEKEIENENKALLDFNEKTSKTEKDCAESGRKIAELKEQIKAGQEAARAAAAKKEGADGLQKQLAGLKKQRSEAETRLKEAEGKLQISQQSVTMLTGMVADAGKQQGVNAETDKNTALLAEEVKQETALAREATARLEKLTGDLKAAEAEKTKLSEDLLRAKERLQKDAQGTNRVNAFNIWLAEQKKVRAEAESKAQQSIQKQQALEKENERLKTALSEADALVKQGEKDLKDSAGAESELRKEKELSDKAAGLVQEKEKSLTKLSAAKNELQGRLNEADARLARQKEKLKNLQEARRAMEEEKQKRAAVDKRYMELAKAEKAQKDQVKELDAKLREDTKETEAVEKKVQKIKIVSPARKGVAPDESAEAAKTAGKDSAATEEEILNKARSGEAKAPVQEGAEKKPEKSTSRGKQNRLDEADARFATGVQKWDENNLEGALADFEEVLKLNPDAAGAYYNISFIYVHQGKRDEACEYAYKAGECYLKIKNTAQATQMAVWMMKINKDSPYIPKLRAKITKAAGK